MLHLFNTTIPLKSINNTFMSTENFYYIERTVIIAFTYCLIIHVTAERNMYAVTIMCRISDFVSIKIVYTVKKFEIKYVLVFHMKSRINNKYSILFVLKETNKSQLPDFSYLIFG